MTPGVEALRERVFLLVKRGLYYGPDNRGYTSIKAYAGRYLETDAFPDSGIEAIHEDDAPMFSKACWEDLKVKYLLEEREAMLNGIEAALHCTPFVRLIGTDAYEVGYDCGDPFEILRTIYQAAQPKAGGGE